MSEPIATERYFAPIPQRANPPVPVVEDLLRGCRADLASKVAGLGRVPVELPTLSIVYDDGVLTAHMDVLTRRKRWYE